MFDKDKQLEERLLQKAFSISFFRKSFFRSSFRFERASQSFFKQRSMSRQSAAESDVSERELQQSIQTTNESFIALIETYVSRKFNAYFEHNIQDVNLYIAIFHDFADFKEEY